VLLGSCRLAFAEDLPNNPPLVPVTIAGTTYYHVLYNDIDNNNTWTVVFYNDSAVTTDAAHAGSDCSSGCPTVGSLVYIGSSYNFGYTGDTTKSSWMLKGTTNVDQRYYYGCSGSFTGCTYYGGAGGASGWLNGTLGINKTTNIHSDLAVYDFGPSGGGGIGCILNCGAPNTATRFISPLVPTASSTVATSSATTIGSHVYVNPADYVEGHTFLVMSYTNYTASLVTGSALQAWDTAFNNIRVPITASSTDIDISTSTTKFEIYQGKTQGYYTIVTEDCSWYSFIFGCSDNTHVASTTYFYIGGKTGFDISQEAGQLGILGLAPGSDPFNATTTNSALDCNIAISFDLNKCLFSFVVPNAYLANQVLSNFKSVPVLGWPIRFVEIIVTTNATSSLPILDYTFAAHNSFLGGVRIHFNPWEDMYVNGSFTKQAVSDQDNHSDVWDIMGPLVKLIVYLTLLFMIIKRLTGLSWGGSDYTTTETGSETVSKSEKMSDGSRKTFTHSITKRRKL